jgi:NitT/TauT family transport system permease protein
MGRSPAADAVLGAFFRLVYPVPKVVFMPIIVVMLGIGDSSKICLIFLAIFFQITIIIRDSTAAIDPALSDVMRSMKAGPADTLRHLILPGITPGILTALKSSLGTSVALLMITELFASTSGLGYFIMNSMDARKYPEMYSGILLLMGMSALMYAFLEIAERLLCRWRYGSMAKTPA